MTRQQILDRLAQIKDELQFYSDNFLDFDYAEFSALQQELWDEQDQLTQILATSSYDDCDDDLMSFDEFMAVELADYNPCEPSSYHIEAETVEVEAVESDDDWLLEEFEAICEDPAGERFQRPQPVFQSFIHYVMFVLGILGKTVSNYLSWQNYNINTNTVIA